MPIIEMFNTFNNKNNINPLSTPALFNFDRTSCGQAWAIRGRSSWRLSSSSDRCHSAAAAT